MESLRQQIDHFEKNSVYTVLDVIKEVPGIRVEKVRHQVTSQLFLRKSMTARQELLRVEYDVLSGLEHPALPVVQDYFEMPGETVLVESYVEGQRLSDRLRDGGGLPCQQAIDIAMQLCDVVAYLHRQQPPVIHRDIKPDNIMCRPDGRIVLLDFGAARTFKADGVRDTVYIGTVGYAPPEQFGYGQSDERVDVHAIGMTLFAMLTGKSPDRGDVITEAAYPSIPVALVKVIAKATAFDPAERYGSVVEMRTAIVRASRAPDRRTVYPRYFRASSVVRCLMIPVHVAFFLFLGIAAIGISGYSGWNPFADGKRFAGDMGILLHVVPAYVLGFNLFNLKERIGFFRKHRRAKKVGLVFASILLGGVLRLWSSRS